MNDEANLGARQIKAARALLDWSQDDLARMSGLSVATIRKIEMGAISPRQTTKGLLRRAFEDAGLEFLAPDGVRHRPDDVQTFYGASGQVAFFQEMAELAKRSASEILLIEGQETSFLRGAGLLNAGDGLGNVGETHVPAKVLLVDGAADGFPLGFEADIRLLSRQFVDAMPFCVVSDRLALIVAAGSDFKIVVIRSRFSADAARQQFFSLWEKAMPYVPQRIIETALRAVA